jgi:hypothetical protein
VARGVCIAVGDAVSLPGISPHDLDAERAVLGAVLVNNAALVAVERIVQPSDFFRDAHCELFRQMLPLRARAKRSPSSHSGTRSVLIVWKRVGGPSYITSLIDGLPRSSNVEWTASVERELCRTTRWDMLVAATTVAAPLHHAPAGTRAAPRLVTTEGHNVDTSPAADVSRGRAYDAASR